MVHKVHNKFKNCNSPPSSVRNTHMHTHAHKIIICRIYSDTEHTNKNISKQPHIHANTTDGETKARSEVAGVEVNAGEG